MAFLLHAAGFAVVTLCIMCSASATAPAPVLIEISDEELQAHSSNMADFVADAIENRNKRDTAPTVYNGEIPFHNSLLVHWAGQGSAIMFAIASNPGSSQSYLYRSTDYGDSFEDETGKLSSQRVHIGGFHPSPHDPNHIVLVDDYNSRVYVTENAGDSFKRVDLGFTLTFARFNTMVDGLLWAVESDGGTEYLRVSVNRGVSWSHRLTDASQRECAYDSAFWGTAKHIPGNKNDTLLVACATSSGSLSLLRVDSVRDALGVSGSGIFRGTDITPTHIPNKLQEGSFLLVHEYMFLAAVERGDSSSGGDSNEDHGDHLELFVSTDGKPFQAVVLPSNTGHVLDYKVLDATEDEIFVGVLHTNSCNVYVAPQEGHQFVLSLEDVVANEERGGGSLATVDFQRLDGVSGIFVANKRMARRGQDATTADVVTLITYDNGGEWTKLRAPAASACVLPECSLNLGMESLQLPKGYQFDLLFTSTSAPGFVLANGNAGTALSFSPKGVYSTDAGVTWAFEPSGLPREFVSVDHGGVLVGATPYSRNSQPIDSVVYSVDEGETWQTFKFSSTAINVVRMLTEHGETSTIVSLWGYASIGGSLKWHIISIDFASVLGEPCGESDYTTWSPRDINSPVGCLLGQQQIFERRKADSVCLNGRNYDRAVSAKSCPCYADDFECDVGFAHVEDDQNVCMPVGDPSDYVDVCRYPGQNVTISRGYRRISGNRCSGGLEAVFEPFSLTCKDPCPTTEWTEWSTCDLCTDRISTRSRTPLADLPSDFCPALEEMKVCELPDFEDVVSVFPEALHVKVDDSVILSALLDGVEVKCSGGGSSTPHLELKWEILTSDGEDASVSYARYDDNLPLNTDRDVLENLKFIEPGVFSIRLTATNGHKQDSATVAVTVYRASGSLDMSWHSSENLGEHQSHYETLVEEMAGGVLREALNLTKRTLFIEDVWVYEQEATVFGKVYYVGKGETDEEFFSRAESALRAAAEGGTTALNLLLPGGRTLTPMANSISVYRDSDIDWYGGDDDWWLWSSTAAVSTTAGSPSHSGSSGGPNNAAAIAVPVSLAIVALVGGVYYYVSRRPFGRTVQYQEVTVQREERGEGQQDDDSDDEMIEADQGETLSGRGEDNATSS